MAEKAKRPWTVLPHSQIEKIDDNLWGIDSYVPGARIPRRMCIIKRTDGSLLFFHAVPLEESVLAQVTAWGTPKYLLVGHDQHMADAHAFAEKLGLKVYGPQKKEKELRARTDIAGFLEDIPSDPSMDFVSVPGTSHGEAAIILRSGGGSRVSIMISDIIQNTAKDATSLIFRILGFSGGPKVVPAFRLLFLKDKTAVKKTLLDWAAIPNLKRIIPFHGSIVDNDAAGALKKIAATL